MKLGIWSLPENSDNSYLLNEYVSKRMKARKPRKGRKNSEGGKKKGKDKYGTQTVKKAD